MKHYTTILLAAAVLAGLSTTGRASETFPTIIHLPAGWGAEGIATGRGTDFYVGSRQFSVNYQGAVYKGDLRTGAGAVLVAPNPARCALGMKLDNRSNALFVAGGPTGAAYVYDGATGTQLAFFQFAASTFPSLPFVTFVNDVTLTRDAAYFTDSFRPYLYRVALSSGGQVATPGVFDQIPLSGDFVQTPGFNVNGIASTANGKALVIVSQGSLYRVDPASGVARKIQLDLPLSGTGDGILLEGQVCYVTQPFSHKIDVVVLDQSLTVGRKIYEITSPSFDMQTTVALFGDALYAVNARFAAGVPLAQAYSVIRVDK